MRIVLSLATILFITPTALAQPADWVTHVDMQRGFSLKYPPGWEIVNFGPAAAFVIAEPERLDEARKNIVVANPAASEDLTVDQHQDREDEFARRTFDDYLIVTRESIEVGPLLGSVAHITRHFGPVHLYQIRLILVAGTRVHFLTGTTDANSPTLSADIRLLLAIMTTYRVRSAPDN